MSVRYFKTPTGFTQVGGLTEDGLRVLLDAEYEEITAEEFQAEQAKQGEAALARLQAGATAENTEQTKGATADGRDGRKRRR